MSPPRWLRGVLDNAEHTVSPNLAHAPDLQEPSREQTRKIALVETDSAILLINEKLKWHSEEVERLMIERSEHQERMADLMAVIGMRVEVAREN